MKTKILSEARMTLDDLVDEGVITREDLDERLLPSDEYAFKSHGTNDYVVNELLPLYPFQIFIIFYFFIFLQYYYYIIYYIFP